MFSFKFICLLFTQFRVPPLTIWLKQQQFASIAIIFYTSFACNINCSIDLYNKDLQTTIILFTCNVSAHKTGWIISELPLLALSCLLYRMVNSLMNGLEGECNSLREISLNVSKSFAVLFCLFCILAIFYTALCYCSFTALFFYTDAIILFIRWSCKQAHYFCFWSFFLSF